MKKFCASDLKLHHAPNALTRMHEVESPIDVLNAHFMRNQRVYLDAAIHIHIDDGGDICAASGSAESDAFPAAACDQLKGTCGDFFAGARDANDIALAPTFMTALQRHAHDIDITYTFECIIRATACDINDMAR